MIIENRPDKPKPRGAEPRVSEVETGERVSTVRMPASLHTRLIKASRGAMAKSLNSFCVEAIESAVVAIESEQTTNSETSDPPDSERD